MKELFVRVWVMAGMLALCACSPRDPNSQFCRRVNLCENLALLMDVDECAVQLPMALRGQDVDCRSCLMSLSCEGLATALNSVTNEQDSQENLGNVCAACAGNRNGIRAELTGDGPSFQRRALIPGLVVRGEPGVSEGTIGSLCERIDSCPRAALLVSSHQCSEQLTRVLAGQPPPCVSCITSLNCEGVARLTRDEVDLAKLCPYCAPELDHSCGPEGCADGAQTYFILPGIVPKNAQEKDVLQKLLAVEPPRDAAVDQTGPALAPSDAKANKTAAGASPATKQGADTARAIAQGTQQAR